MYTDADVQYILEQFVPLEDLCHVRGADIHEVRRRIVAGEMPLPPYRGFELVPDDYFDLPDAREFMRSYHGAVLADDLNAYLAGTYFVCLVHATLDSIVRKEALVTELRRLLADPRPDDEVWVRAMREQVDELDGLERPFSPDYDRTRFGRPPTRDELIDEPRRRWPRLFAQTAH
jgi:hypothetical protein